MNGPKFTLITVTLNNLNDLIKTLTSLKSQVYDNYEIVIIDGGSSDGTRDFLESGNSLVQKTRWISESDNGVYDAMNKGAHLAKGEIINFINSGDTLADDFVLSRVSLSFLDHKWKWAYGISKLMTVDGVFSRLLLQIPFSSRRLALGLSFAPHQSTFYCLDFFKQVGKFEDIYSFASDQEFAIRASKLYAPHVEIDIWANFVAGGLHSKTTYWNRELLYHEIRKNNRDLVLESNSIDVLYSISMGTYREMREFLNRLLARKSYRDL